MHVEIRSLIGNKSCHGRFAGPFPFHQAAQNVIHLDIVGAEAGADLLEKGVHGVAVKMVIHLRRHAVRLEIDRQRAHPFPVAIVT